MNAHRVRKKSDLLSLVRKTKNKVKKKSFVYIFDHLFVHYS